MQTDPHNMSSPRPSDNFAEKVLERIQEERVVPRPRWQFFVRENLPWVLLLACLVIGAAAAAAMMFAFANAGWKFRVLTHDSWLSFLIETAPFVWILIFIAVVAAVIENIRHTKTGYRYPFSTLLVLGLLGTLVGGALFYAAGIGKRVDEEIGPRFHLVRRTVAFQQQHLWTNPVRGLLAGEVVAVEDGGARFRLRTFDGTEWMVNGEDLNAQSRAVLTHVRFVRVVGVPLSTPDAGGATFQSCFVFPWELIEPMRIPLPSATNSDPLRTTECEGVRPYAFLKKLQSEFRYEE
jgi:hypothetical protein